MALPATAVAPSVAMKRGVVGVVNDGVDGDGVDDGDNGRTELIRTVQDQFDRAFTVNEAHVITVHPSDDGCSAAIIAHCENMKLLHARHLNPREWRLDPRTLAHLDSIAYCADAKTIQVRVDYTAADASRARDRRGQHWTALAPGMAALPDPATVPVTVLGIECVKPDDPLAREFITAVAREVVASATARDGNIEIHVTRHTPPSGVASRDAPDYVITTSGLSEFGMLSMVPQAWGGAIPLRIRESMRCRFCIDSGLHKTGIAQEAVSEYVRYAQGLGSTMQKRPLASGNSAAGAKRGAATAVPSGLQQFGDVDDDAAAATTSSGVDDDDGENEGDRRVDDQDGARDGPVDADGDMNPPAKRARS